MAELEKNEIRAARQLADLIRVTGTKTVGAAMVAIREWRFGTNHPRRLTLAELHHLSGLLEARRESGDYTGPREQYYARTERLIEWCNEQIQQHRDEILRRRRAAMPNYDKKLEEWLS